MKLHKVIKHVFIPHEGNEYKPHFFRETAVASILFCSIFLLGASFGSSFLIHKTVLGANIASGVLVDLANDARLAYNESPLIRSDILDQAASLKGQDMARLGYFSHNSPTGVTPWHWFKEVGYVFLYAGENLAINFNESKDIQNAWLASPLHRANLLDVHFREIGIATIEGVYNGNPTTYVVQMFGTPVFPQLSKATTTTATTTLATTTKITTATTTFNPKPTINIATSNLATNTLAITTEKGKVKGESIESTSSIKKIVITESTSSIKTVVTTPELVIVKDESQSSSTEKILNSTQTKYSTWYGRALFGGSRYVDTFYKGLIILIAIALLTSILVEVKKQHTKHILYGVLLLVILTIFVYINRGFF